MKIKKIKIFIARFNVLLVLAMMMIVIQIANTISDNALLNFGLFPRQLALSPIY